MTWRLSAWGRHAGVALMGALLVAALATAVNVAGIRAVGSVDSWQRWLLTHAGYFLVWRLGLYAATAWGWWRMRARMCARLQSPAAETRHRLIRAEIAAAVAVVLIEGSRWLPHA